MNEKHKCWTCKKALNSGCSWSKDNVVVAGWVAAPTKRKGIKGVTYMITNCPQYEYNGLCKRCVYSDDNIEQYDICDKYQPTYSGDCRVGKKHQNGACGRIVSYKKKGGGTP